MYTLLLLSAGKGTRMERELPKQYLLLAGKPMIIHTLERVDNIPEIREIIIVCEKEFIKVIELMLRQYNIITPVRFAEGGRTRQESVYNGLLLVDSDSIIIHEAARPFVLQSEFQKLIDNQNKNVILGYSIPFTVTKGNKIITGLLKRDELVNVQLPQKFDVAVLKKVHEQAKDDEREFTEDSSMIFEYSSESVVILEGSSSNIKITEPIDLIMGEVIYREYIAGRK